MMITIMMIIVFNKHIWDDYPLPLGKIFRVVKNHERLRARWELFASGCFPNVWASGVFFCVSLGMEKNSGQTKMGCHGDLMVFHMGFNGDLL